MSAAKGKTRAGASADLGGVISEGPAPVIPAPGPAHDPAREAMAAHVRRLEDDLGACRSVMAQVAAQRNAAQDQVAHLTATVAALREEVQAVTRERDAVVRGRLQ